MEVPSDMQQNSEVDVNVLVNLYHTKLAAALNQNVLLEAKLQTLKNDFQKEKNELLEQLANQTDSNGSTKQKRTTNKFRFA